MKRVTFIIPKLDNNGKRFPAKVLAELRRDILEIAGGYTWRHVRGAWYDEDDGTTYQDASWEYTVVMEEAKIEELLRWLEKAKNLLAQQAMWVEVQETDSRLV
jgi:squalene cyclase